MRDKKGRDRSMPGARGSCMRLRTRLVTPAIVTLLCAGALSAANRELPLLEAVKNQDRETVRALLKQKIDVNAREGDGATALHWAVLRHDVETIDGLLRAGADVNAANDYGVTPISLACAGRNTTTVKKL